MNNYFKTRQLYPAERRLLQTLRNQKEKEGSPKIKFYHYFVAALLGVVFTYLATLTKDTFWVLPLGTIAVFAFAFIVFTPYETYKLRKRNGKFLQQITSFIDKGTIDTWLIDAKRIAIAKEYEDEGDLFMIEYDTDEVLYLWDHDYSMQKQFPCLKFEIYEESFVKLLGRQISPLSNRIDPTKQFRVHSTNVQAGTYFSLIL